MILRVDMTTGAAGDMLLGGFLDMGLPQKELEACWDALGLTGYRYQVKKVDKKGISACSLTIELTEPQPVRHLCDILAILDRSTLEQRVCEDAKKVFDRLAQAEAKVHGVSKEEIHFHEVGAVDAILDVVGFCFALFYFGIEEVSFSSFPCGQGAIWCEHGKMPNPAPATQELLRGQKIEYCELKGELVTPTAAAILTSLGSARSPVGTLCKTGLGAGSYDLEEANVVRLSLLEPQGSKGYREEKIVVLTAWIEDMQGREIASLLRELYREGALEVTLSSRLTKKNRPMFVLECLSSPEQKESLAGYLLKSSSTLGVRWRWEARWIKWRQEGIKETPWGKVRVKEILDDPASDRSRWEFEHEDIVALAQEQGRAVWEFRQELEKWRREDESD